VDNGKTFGTEDDINRLGERLTPERMKGVDRFYLTPRERADKVWAVIQVDDFNKWDMLCFCVEYLGQLAISYAMADRVFKSGVLLLGRWLHNAHYFFASEIYGEPDEEGSRK